MHDNKLISDKKKGYNQQLSLYIKVGAMVVKRFKETQDEKSKSVILDCIEHSTRLKDKEAFERLLKLEQVYHV